MFSSIFGPPGAAPVAKRTPCWLKFTSNLRARTLKSSAYLWIKPKRPGDRLCRKINSPGSNCTTRPIPPPPPIWFNPFPTHGCSIRRQNHEQANQVCRTYLSSKGLAELSEQTRIKGEDKVFSPFLNTKRETPCTLPAKKCCKRQGPLGPKWWNSEDGCIAIPNCPSRNKKLRPILPGNSRRTTSLSVRDWQAPA